MTEFQKTIIFLGFMMLLIFMWVGAIKIDELEAQVQITASVAPNNLNTCIKDCSEECYNNFK
jgi:hypothetical protein